MHSNNILKGVSCLFCKGCMCVWGKKNTEARGQKGLTVCLMLISKQQIKQSERSAAAGLESCSFIAVKLFAQREYLKLFTGMKQSCCAFS